MKTTSITVSHPVGLHARPAAVFVNAAKKFASTIEIRNMTKNGNWSNAKSILGILTLGIEKDYQIEIKADGLDENQAIQSLSDLVRSNFGGVS